MSAVLRCALEGDAAAREMTIQALPRCGASTIGSSRIGVRLRRSKSGRFGVGAVTGVSRFTLDVRAARGRSRATHIKPW
jgi:hypothetical protein